MLRAAGEMISPLHAGSQFKTFLSCLCVLLYCTVHVYLLLTGVWASHTLGPATQIFIFFLVLNNGV